MTTQWHCLNCSTIFKLYRPSLDNRAAGIADGAGLRNSQSGNDCWNCGAGQDAIVADN